MSKQLTESMFEEAAMAWLESRKPYISERTYDDYRKHIITLSMFFSQMRLQEITADQVRAYQRARMSRAGGGLINHECGVLQQMLKRIGRWPEIGPHYQPLPTPKESPHRALTPDEEARLYRIGASNPKWDVAYCAFIISINTTAGPGEIRHVRRKDVEMYHVEGPLFHIQPKGAKNPGRIRTLPLNEPAANAMQYLLDRAEKLGSVMPDDYVIPYMVKTGYYDPSRPCKSWRTALASLLAAADIHVSAYTFRHHAITKLLENPEVSEETAEALAGHITHQMKKRYSHTRLHVKRAAVEALQNIYRGTAPTERAHRPEKRRQRALAVKGGPFLLEG
jgi:integrase